MTSFRKSGVVLGDVQPLLDGAVPACSAARVVNGIEWTLDGGGRIALTVAEGDVVRLDVSASGLAETPLSLGLRFGAVSGVRRYLRNGYHSWDGSFFADPGTPAGKTPQVRNREALQRRVAGDSLAYRRQRQKRG